MSETLQSIVSLASGTKIKLALLLTALSSGFLWHGELDGAQWIGLVEWIYTAFALANVAAPMASRIGNAPPK